MEGSKSLATIVNEVKSRSTSLMDSSAVCSVTASISSGGVRTISPPPACFVTSGERGVSEEASLLAESKTLKPGGRSTIKPSAAKLFKNGTFISGSSEESSESDGTGVFLASAAIFAAFPGVNSCGNSRYSSRYYFY